MNEESLFIEALEVRDPAERAAFLDKACAGDAAARDRLERLLDLHERTGDFLSKPAPQGLAERQAADADATDQTRTGPLPVDGDERLDFLTPSEQPDSLGRLGHYDILEVIGKGGMGIVLRAFDSKLHRVVAIKVMAAQLATNATARKRFTREARAQAAVSHDHIVTIHAVEEANGLPYLVMQYVAGVSLQERLDKSGSLQLSEILRIGMQTASGLAAAHAQGLVHRDIKPANILLENGVERVKITDFGLARAATDASLTQSGVVAGTPHYMSPEQARGDSIDQRTDLFSLGSVLYAMCTGRAPFRASGSMAVLKRVCEETPSPIRETNPEVPDWLAALIDKLHAKEPAQRYQSAAEVAELLGRHLAHVQHPSVMPLPAAVPPASARREPIDTAEASDGPRPPRTRRRRWAVAAALLFLLIGGFGMTEATGVTNLRATVIRIFTGDGTLIIEVNDPGVKVTVEGDGDLVITGAGPQEVRLKPGSYKLHAAKDG
jgi:serine/threonine protein kinase